ncbi:MAG: hypothetical protein ACYC8T_07220 [Myxococcaceae bacterium]
MPAQRARRIDVLVLVALTCLAALPVLVSRFLPFFDYAAHLVVPAALHFRGDPASGIDQDYTFVWGAFPNSLHYAFTWALAGLMPLEAASRAFVILFCIAALPPAVAFALRAFGRDPRLCLLAIPLVYGRWLFYGFIGFSAALPLSMVVVALVKLELEAPSARRRWILALAMATLPFLHFFVMVVTFGLALMVVALWLAEKPGRAVASALPLLAGPAVMLPWFVSNLRAGPGTAESPLTHLLAQRLPLAGYAGLPMHWFMDAYAAHFDEALAVLMVVTVAAIMGLKQLHEPGATVTRRAAAAPLLLAAALVVGFVALPFEITTPFHWWAMNVRLLPLAFLWLLVATPAGRLSRAGRLALAPLALASAAYFVFLTVDFRGYYNGPAEGAALGEVLTAVPKGAHVLGLYTDIRAPMHYSHYPHHYDACAAVVQGGGVCAPFVPIPQSWTNPREVPDHPFAGDVALFDFDRHAAGFSHFLVRTCDGAGCLPDPLAAHRAVHLTAASGRWRIYSCTSRDLCIVGVN